MLIEYAASNATACIVDVNLKTDRKYQVIDITSRVEEIVKHSGVSLGLCHVYVCHTTAAVTVNENADPNIGGDLVTALHRLIPEGVWQHDLIDDNGSAHIKASMIGASEMLPVRDGKLVLGTWQAVMLVEFDGPRERQLVVTVR